MLENQRIGIGCLHNNGKYWWDYFEFHKSADLAFSVFDQKRIPDFVNPLFGLNPDEILSLGTFVCAFGFPLTESSRNMNGKTDLIINEVFFSGYIPSIYDKMFLKDIPMAFSTNYALSFECFKGLSGTPLLVIKNGTVHVCGMIYGNKTIQYLIEEIYESESEREKLYKVYHLGLASTLKELGEAPE